MPRTIVVLLVASICVACHRAAQEQQQQQQQQRHDRDVAAAMLHGILAYPQSSVISVASGVDAAQATATTAASVAEVATWYRRMLRLNGWDLQNDAVTRDGGVAIFAQKGTRPLWITLKATAGGPGTTYTLIGAELPTDSVQDSAAQRSGSSMSSNRIQRR